jgi:hypothetical protein
MTKGQKIAAFAIAVVCGIVFAWLWYAYPQRSGGKVVEPHLVGWIAGILGLILLFDLPICFLILIGHPPVMTLSPLLPSGEERACRRQVRERPLLTDDAFYERFYANTGVSKEIVSRLRRLYAEQLPVPMEKVWPADKATDVDWELDFADVLGMVESEFGICFTKEDLADLNGSFDSLVRSVAKKSG